MEFDIWMLLSGVGILIFGMSVFEDAIKYLGGNKLKYILQKYTSNSWNSILSGTVVTGLLQSSSLVSLMALAFAGAGVIALSNTIGVIIGANIGTTVTSLIIAKVGFGDFKISQFALPLIAIGGLALIFVQNEKWKQIAKLFIGFGLLFLGLDFMKESVEALKASFDLASYKDYSLWSFGLLGIIVTIMIQSSSAVGILTLAALASGLITFPASIAIVMGSNIGTTVTAVIASLGGDERIKRQVALSQVLFNVISAIIGIVFFWQYIRLTMDFLGFKDNPIMGNAILNAIFNISTAVLFGFFLKPFTRMIEWMMPAHKGDKARLRILDANVKRKDDTFALANLYALHEDGKTLIDQIFSYNVYSFGFKEALIKSKKSSVKDILKGTHSIDPGTQDTHYGKAKYTSDIMLEHLLSAKLQKLPKGERELAEHIESTIAMGTKSAKSIKNIRHDIEELRDSPSKIMKDLYSKIMNNAAVFYKHVATIIDRKYSKENFEELNEALQHIKKDHNNFVEYLTKDLIKNATKKELQEIDIATLLNLNHYLYQSAKRFATAIQHTYLTHDEEKIFKKLRVVEEG